MDTPAPEISILNPPIELPGFHKNDWFEIPSGDSVLNFIVEHLWKQPESPVDWESARLSKAAYLYREKSTQWTVLVKFYSSKVRSPESADRYATNEYQRMEQAYSYSKVDGPLRTPKPLAYTNGVLFLEYIDGLTLEDIIAVRRNRPGTLLPALEKTSWFLSALHSQHPQPEFPIGLNYEIADTSKFIDELAEKGVLEGNPVVVTAFRRLIERWAGDSAMSDYTPTFIHGDATTSNFVFSWNGGLFAIDWERMDTADPATDLGRLLAEVAHSIQQYGGDYSEAEPLLNLTVKTYIQGLPSDWDIEALRYRARFYQASSTLRIARNGWLPPLQRVALVAQALSLLA